MQKCFYHAKTDAITMCMGCKMPICQTCKDEGKKGFCDSCMKKVSSLGDQISDMKKTGMVQSAHKATMIKQAGRPTGPRNVTYCYHHFDIVASATCPTCNRPFCPACLNSAGICSHCSKHSEAAQQRLFAPNERGRAIMKEVREAENKGKMRPKDWLIAGVAVLALLIAWKVLHKPAPKVDYTSETLNRLHALEEEKVPDAQLAILQQAHNQRRVGIPDPVETPEPAPQGGGSAAQVSSGAVSAGRSAATGGGSARAPRVRVGVAAPGSGSTVRGVTRVRGSVAGSPGRVDFLVDGQWQGSVNSQPFAFDWASQAVGNGSHRITLEAYGESGLLSRSSVNVNVAN